MVAARPALKLHQQQKSAMGGELPSAGQKRLVPPTHSQLSGNHDARGTISAKRNDREASER